MANSLLSVGSCAHPWFLDKDTSVVIPVRNLDFGFNPGAGLGSAGRGEVQVKVSSTAVAGLLYCAVFSP